MKFLTQPMSDHDTFYTKSTTVAGQPESEEPVTPRTWAALYSMVTSVAETLSVSPSVKKIASPKAAYPNRRPSSLISSGQKSCCHTSQERAHSEVCRSYPHPFSVSCLSANIPMPVVENSTKQSPYMQNAAILSMAIAEVAARSPANRGVFCKALFYRSLLQFLVPFAEKSDKVVLLKQPQLTRAAQPKQSKNSEFHEGKLAKEGDHVSEDKFRHEYKEKDAHNPDDDMEMGVSSEEESDYEHEDEEDFSVQSDQYPLLAAMSMVLKQVMVKAPKLSAMAQYTEDEREAFELFDNPCPSPVNCSAKGAHDALTKRGGQMSRKQLQDCSWTYQWKHARVSSQDIFDFSIACFRIARWSMESHVYALVLILRVVKTTPLQLHYGNWRRLLLTSLLISQKLADDVPLRNKEFPVVLRMVMKLGNPVPRRMRVCTPRDGSKRQSWIEYNDPLYGLENWYEQQMINLKQINKMEITLLQLVGYDAFVSTATYYQVHDELMLMQKGAHGDNAESKHDE